MWLNDFDGYLDKQEARPYVRTKLTTNQHILHLLLTIVTGGLWVIVWIIRGIQGNKVDVHPYPGTKAYGEAS
jgi:hypothetical protein